MLVKIINVNQERNKHLIGRIGVASRDTTHKNSENFQVYNISFNDGSNYNIKEDHVKIIKDLKLYKVLNAD